MMRKFKSLELERLERLQVAVTMRKDVISDIYYFFKHITLTYK